jgi:hypothetical protein
MPPESDSSAFPHPSSFGYDLKNAEPWVYTFHEKHWGDHGGVVPTEVIVCDETDVRIVDPDSLPSLNTIRSWSRRNIR